MTKEEFRAAVESYCQITGADGITSYWRSARRNKAVEGKDFSSHQVWLGSDVVYFGSNVMPVETRKVWAQRLGLFMYPEGDHDHLQPLDWKAG